MKSIKVDVNLSFDEMSKFDKNFHAAIINEVLAKGVEHLHPFNIKIDEIKKSDISYDMSE